MLHWSLNREQRNVPASIFILITYHLQRVAYPFGSGGNLKQCFQLQPTGGPKAEK